MHLDLDLPRVLVLVRNYIRLPGERDIACVFIGSQTMHPLEPNLTLETGIQPQELSFMLTNP